jgi:hypothetical protein
VETKIFKIAMDLIYMVMVSKEGRIECRLCPMRVLEIKFQVRDRQSLSLVENEEHQAASGE